MSAGLDVFDKTLQSTHVWLKEIESDTGLDRRSAWKVLSVVLQELRDRLPAELAAHLAAELPLLVRGAYYDQYKPSEQPSDCGTFDEFASRVGVRLLDARPADPQAAARAVFASLSRHVVPGQIAKVQRSLPKSIRAAWRNAEACMSSVPEASGDGAGI
jgi:uncharacterized protein (DUF2267 family)